MPAVSVATRSCWFSDTPSSIHGLASRQNGLGLCNRHSAVAKHGWRWSSCHPGWQGLRDGSSFHRHLTRSGESHSFALAAQHHSINDSADSAIWSVSRRKTTGPRGMRKCWHARNGDATQQSHVLAQNLVVFSENDSEPCCSVSRSCCRGPTSMKLWALGNHRHENLSPHPRRGYLKHCRFFRRRMHARLPSVSLSS